MTRAELGIARGYGGIWNDIEYTGPTVIPNYKYDDRLDYDWEDMVWSSEEMRHVVSPEAQKKFFVHGGTLYKLVNPDGVLHPWMNGVDPLANR